MDYKMGCEYKEKDKAVRKRRRQIKQIAAVMLLCLTGLLSGVTQKLYAEETDAEGTEVSYTVEKVQGKINMLVGEARYVSASIPYTATFESSDPKIAAVANSGLVMGKKKGTVRITQTDGTTKKVYTVKVNDTVDLIIFAGQSNMCGSGGNSGAAPKPDTGTAYEFDISTNTKKCITMKEPFGEGTNRVRGLNDSGSYSTKGTLVSAFCINYYKQTKIPVVGVSASWGGTSTNTWLNRGLVKETQRRVKLAKKYMKKNGIKIRHIYMVWYQGESDAAQGLEGWQYNNRMKKIYTRMKKVGVEKVFMIQIGQHLTQPGETDSIAHAQTVLCKKNKNFIMVSKSPYQFGKNPGTYHYDAIHINQTGLNKIGYEAGKAAGKYVKKHK